MSAPAARQARKRPPKKRASPAKKPGPQSFLEPLGIVGWRRLEPVLLGALALEAPVLLVGSHGTAKSLLIERLADALALGFRHYNASLLSYDDLVGIPVPDESGSELRFLGTPGAIWGVGFVLFDEISRCRPDLQNKLFPIVHERRVAGVELPDLRHRWAAMNPPASEDADGSGAEPVYLGSEALDPALADRFAFVVRVPGWRELSAEERLQLVSGAGDAPRPPRAGRGARARSLGTLVAHCGREVARVELEWGARIAEYVVELVELLGQAKLAASPRRARTLARGVAAVHAARTVLEGPEVELEESAELALRHGLPQAAEEEPPSLATLRAAHRQAWDLTEIPPDDPRREIFAEPDSVRRVAIAVERGLETADLSRVTTQALAREKCDVRRMGLATAIFLGLKDRCTLTPAAWEALAEASRRVLEPRERREHIATGPDLETWREVSSWMSQQDHGQPRAALERGFLLAGFPGLWRNVRWRSALRRFQKDLDLLGVTS